MSEPTEPNAQAARRAALATLAEATPAELSAGLEAFPKTFATDLRQPEIGLVMLRGRTGGDGAPFNFGEATVARAVVQLASGEVGYGLRLGRDKAAARSAAILDALWQSPAGRTRVERHVLEPVRDRLAATRTRKDAATSATRVDFFTLARGSE